MRKIAFINTNIIVLSLFFSACAFPAEITLAADQWCPINCTPGSQKPGFMVEIAQTIFKQRGHTIKYVKLPWKRAILMTESGEFNGVIGAFRGDAPNFIFPEIEQAKLTNSFYALKDFNWTFNGIESLQKVTLGVIIGYDYGEALNNYIKSAPKGRVLAISGDSDLVGRLIHLLELKRVDIVIEVDHVFLYEAQKSGKLKLLSHKGNASLPMEAYIAFSPVDKNSLEYSKILSEGMKELTRSGELTSILEKYGISR